MSTPVVQCPWCIYQASPFMALPTDHLSLIGPYTDFQKKAILSMISEIQKKIPYPFRDGEFSRKLIMAQAKKWLKSKVIYSFKSYWEMAWHCRRHMRLFVWKIKPQTKRQKVWSKMLPPNLTDSAIRWIHNSDDEWMVHPSPLPKHPFEQPYEPTWVLMRPEKNEGKLDKMWHVAALGTPIGVCA